MRYLAIIIFLLLGSNYVFSQEVEIFGKVTDSNRKPLSGATINYFEEQGTVSDFNGDFYIKSEFEESIQLTIRFIGYTTIDTIINIDNQLEVFLEIEMTQEVTKLPDVEITTGYQNIFENYKPQIVDFTISNDLIYLIVKKGRKSFLCNANLKGVVLEEQILEGGYSKFHNSCLGGIILVGKVNCAELHNVNGQLLVTNEFSIEYFDDYMLPCKLKINDDLIFKTATRHNKKIDFFTFKEHGEPLIFHTVYDQAGDRVSQSYFNDILREYYSSLESPHYTDIDYGIERDYQIERKIVIPTALNENNFLDLLLSDTIQELVLQYQALGKKAIRSDLFVVDEQVYILDQFNNLVLNITDDFEIVETECLFDFKDDVSIITDNKHSTFIRDDNDLYSVIAHEEGLIIQKKTTLDYIYFTNRIQLYKGTLYRLGRKTATKTQTTLFREKVD